MIIKIKNILEMMINNNNDNNNKERIRENYTYNERIR